VIQGWSCYRRVELGIHPFLPLECGAEIFPGIYNDTNVVFQEILSNLSTTARICLEKGMYSIEGLERLQSNFDTPDFKLHELPTYYPNLNQMLYYP
jgi:hypothetical protein